MNSKSLPRTFPGSTASGLHHLRRWKRLCSKSVFTNRPARQNRAIFAPAWRTEHIRIVNFFPTATVRICHCISESPSDDVGILLPRSPSNHFVINGINLGDDQLAVAQTSEGMNISGPGPIGSDCIVMSTPRFTEMLEVLCPTARTPKGLTLVKVFAPELGALGDLIVNQIGAPEVNLQSERTTNLLAWTVSLIGHASDQYRPENINGLKAHGRIAKGARDYIEINFQMPVHAEELCKHTGVGVRTLQRSFKEYFGHSVTDYLKTVRLDAACRELTAADSRETNVTEIALGNGFTHLGRFSLAYRTRFGESPSETLGV